MSSIEPMSPVPPKSSTTLLRRIVRRVRHRSADADPALEDIAVIEASQQFDKEWYKRRYPDVAASGMDPVQHYVRHGAAEGRNPRKDFDTAYYLKNNPDVAASSLNPFRHYVEHGEKEGRAPFSGSRARPTLSDTETIARSGVFDEQYYLAAHPGAVRPGMDPITHYLQRGAKDNMNPCAWFDTKYYLTHNPDVAASGMNPLVHFCRYGFQELRNPSDRFDAGWYWLVYLKEDTTTNPLAHYLSTGLRDGLEIRCISELSDEEKSAFATTCIALLHEGANRARDFYVRVGIILARLARWADAEAAFHSALAADWNDAMLHARLATVLAEQGKWWQAVESWTSAAELDARRPEWHFHLGEALERMNRFVLAAEAYRRAIERKPGNARWHYCEGYMWEKAGEQKLAEAAYKQAIALAPGGDLQRFGAGVFHQKRGYWSEAARAYELELEHKPDVAELHFRLGMANDRCYRWREAEEAYRNAIALNPRPSYWHYRYGFVLERQERYLEAAEAYAAAIIFSSKRMTYWHYRRGYVLSMAGKHEEACLAYIETREEQTLSSGAYKREESTDLVRLSAYLKRFPGEELIARAIDMDAADAGRHYRLGEIRERRSDWTGAAAAYAAAVARSNTHRPEWYYRLGYVLFRNGQLLEACDAFRETRAFRLAYGVDTGIYSKDPEVYGNMQYRENVDVLPVQDRTILYESTHGAAVGGNPYAIFEYLLDHPDYRGWLHVWVVLPDVTIPDKLRSRSSVVFVQHGSDLYRRYLATASHLVNDSTFPYWFSRRAGQKYLNTWHGTPLKTLGKPIRAEEEFLSHRNIQRNLLHATHLISPNPHTSNVLMNDFDVRGICTAKLAETGYPRIDRTLNAKPEHIAGIRAALRLKHGTPVVLYAPTWRGIFGQTQVDVDRLRKDIQKLATLPCQLVFRGHPFSEELLREGSLPVVIASSKFDTADVLAVTDILVTDYSSIFFDFLPTGRPIFHYCYDLAEYTASRGLYFNIYDMPGTVCLDIDTLVRGVDRQLAQGEFDAGRYESAAREFCPYEDGCATLRAVDFFFNDDDSRVVTRYKDDRPSLLFFGGHFAPNGINSSFLNLMHSLQETGRYRITIGVEPRRIKSEPSWLKNFYRLPTDVIVTGKVGRMVQNPEQAWVASKFRENRTFASTGMREVLQSAYRDEYRRCFGDARIDVLVDFDGYNGYWAMLFGFGRSGQRNYCWLHNDIFQEFIVRYPNLATQFALYESYDRLISVSEMMEQVNREKLGTRLRLPAHKFGHCVNMIDADHIRQSANAKVKQDLASWFGRGVTFLTIGRMSPEKDHAKLLNAFARVHARRPDTRLVVMGDGPLHLALEQQIKRLGLEDSVYLAGQRPNPYPALRQCDCFILASNHEGQPMVLLEAMVLGKPIIATDIDGNRGILGSSYGHLVDNDVDRLCNGMLDFLQGKLSFQEFDAKTYCATALQEFAVATSR